MMQQTLFISNNNKMTSQNSTFLKTSGFPFDVTSSLHFYEKDIVIDLNIALLFLHCIWYKLYSVMVKHGCTSD